MTEPLIEMKNVETTDEAIIQMKGIEKHFGSVIALSGVSLDVLPGECHCLLGDNGAGKSTFIKTMSGVHKPSAGEIYFEGKPMNFARPRDAIAAGIATVYQDLAMIPLMSVTRNFFMGNEPTKKIAGISFFDHEHANEVTMEEILILDEPTSALGVRQTANVLATVDRVRKQGIGVVFITHNVRHAMAVGDRYTVLDRGKTLGTAKRGEITPEELQNLMAGGQELATLEGSLGGTV